MLQQPYMGCLALWSKTGAQVIFQHAFTAVIAKAYYLQRVASKDKNFPEQTMKKCCEVLPSPLKKLCMSKWTKQILAWSLGHSACFS